MTHESTARDAQDEVDRRVRHLLERLPASKRRLLNVHHRPKVKVALLPEERTLRLLQEHRILKLFTVLDTKSVHTVLTKILVARSSNVNARDDSHGGTAPDHARLCVECKQGTIEARTDCWSCNWCGLVTHPNIDHGNPYREFDDKESRRHFECVGRQPRAVSSDTVHDGVSIIGGQLQMSTVSMIKATELLRAHPWAGDSLTAAAAALISVTTAYDACTGQLSALAPPMTFPCVGCGVATDSMRSARFHCRVAPKAVQRRPGAEFHLQHPYRAC